MTPVASPGGEMIVSHIVAMAENRVIGRGGALPWHIPEDLKSFRRLTTGHPIVMGRKTFQSIGRALPGRLNVVLTRDAEFRAPDGVVVVSSFSEAVVLCDQRRDEWGSEIFVIGGGEIYAQTLASVDRIYMTRVHQRIDGDARYPELDEAAFRVASESSSAGETPFTFVVLERR